MSRDIFDRLKRERDICVKTVILGQYKMRPSGSTFIRYERGLDRIFQRMRTGDGHNEKWRKMVRF